MEEFSTTITAPTRRSRGASKMKDSHILEDVGPNPMAPNITGRRSNQARHKQVSHHLPFDICQISITE